MKKNLFLNYFPIPDFLQMSSIGLDISDGSVRFVELVNSDKSKLLGKFGKIDLPNDKTVVKGEIIDKIALVKILESIKKEHKFDFVRVSITENNSYVFKTQIPKNTDMDYEEVRAILSFKLEENVPLTPENAVFDFDIIGEDKNNLDIVVTVLPKNIVDQFVDVFDEVGFIPLSFEVEAQAVARAVVKEGDKGTYMLVDFRSTRASISIISDGIVQLTSTIDVGGDDLISAIEKQMSIPLEEAKKVKKEKGFIKENSNDNLFFAMMNTVSVLKDEMNKYLVYWHTHKNNQKEGKIKRKVEKIILCGSSGSLRGLDDYLSLSIGLKVERANVWKNIFSLDNFVPDMDFNTSLEYAAAIGLAMRMDENIFLNKKKSKLDEIIC